MLNVTITMTKLVFPHGLILFNQCGWVFYGTLQELDERFVYIVYMIAMGAFFIRNGY